MTTTVASDKHRGLLNINHLPTRQAIGNRCHSAHVLAIGSNTVKFNTTGAIVYSVGGVTQTISAVTDGVMTVASSDDGSTLQAFGTTCWYAATVTAAKAYAAYKGKDGVTSVLPSVPSNVSVFGLVKVVNASASVNFTMGTTAYNASDVTTTFYDCSVMPVSPP